MFTNYANFKDRTNKHDFWWAILGYFVLAFIVGFVAGFIGGIAGDNGSITNIVTTIFELATIIPVLALELEDYMILENLVGIFFLD